MKYSVIIILTTIFSFFQTFLSGQSVTSFQRTYGRMGYNTGRCAYQTDDGGYIILGNISGLVGNTDIYLAKTDTLGKIIWDKAIGGTEIEWANDFKITHDKGYIIAGYTDIIQGNGYDVLLIKTDSLGNIKWEKTFGGTDWDMGYAVIEDKNFNFLIAGTTYSNSYGDADVYLIKTDSLGDTLWTRHYGGTGSDIAYSIDTTKFSDYLLSGVTRKITDTTYDAYLLKISNDGDTLFTRKYGDILNDKFYCARQIDDSSYIICGSTQDYGAINYDPWILKTDTFGNIRWPHVSVNSGNEEYFDIKRSWKNGLVATGYTTTWGMGNGDAVGTVMDSGGNDIFGRTYGGIKYDISYSVNLTRDSCYIYTGTTESFGLGLTNIFFIKTDKNGNAPSPPTQETGISELYVNSNNTLIVYPNPTEGLIKIYFNHLSSTNIQLKVFNDIGEVLINEEENIANTTFIKTIDLSCFPNGIYLIQISSNNISSILKVIKQSSR